MTTIHIDGTQVDCPYCSETIYFALVGVDQSVGMNGSLEVKEGHCAHYRGMNDDHDKVMFELTKEEGELVAVRAAVNGLIAKHVGNYGPYDPECGYCTRGEVSSTTGGDGYAEVDEEGPCQYCTEEGIAYRRESEMQHLPSYMWSKDWTKDIDQVAMTMHDARRAGATLKEEM